MTIPNMLTVGRILLTPVLVWLIVKGRLTYAALLFFIAGMSDAVDGFIARQFNQKSRFGAYVDPLADKILLVSSFIALWYAGKIPLWLVAITVGRDLLILSGFFYLYFSGLRVEMRPLVVSKATTFFQLLTIFALLGSELAPLPGAAYSSLFLITAALSIYSGWRYVSIGMSLTDARRGGDAGA